jgi:ADP-heptose:LPS heptosyltransferase
MDVENINTASPVKRNYDNIYLEYKGALGDTICLTAFLPELKKKYGKQISVVSSWPTIFENNPYVKYIVKEPSIERFLGAKIILRKIIPESIIRKIKRTIFVRPNRGDKVLSVSQEFLFANRHLHLMEALAISIGLKYNGQLPDYHFGEVEIQAVLKKFNLTDMKKYITISPFARWLSRQWDDNSFQELIKYYENKGYTILILGAKKDEYVGAGLNLVGLTTVRESAVIINNSALYIGVDGGLAHLAAAVQTKAIVLFGPVFSIFRKHPGLTFPVENYQSCRGCSHFLDLSKNNPLRECPFQHRNCMISIKPFQVIAEIDEIVGMK